MSDAIPREYAEQHRKVMHHIELLGRVAKDMDLIDMAYKLGDWVELAGVDFLGDRGQKLSTMLTAFEKMVTKHFAWEEKHILPDLDSRGATDFCRKLEDEHRGYSREFHALRKKMESFRALGPDQQRDKQWEDAIKADLGTLMKKLEVHALEEEDAFFLVDHNV